MQFGYVNGNCRQAIATQVAALEKHGIPKGKIWIDPKGSSEEFAHLTAKDSGIGRGIGHAVVVAEFHHLATNREDLVSRLAAIHCRGAFVVETAIPDRPSRSTESRKALVEMLLEALSIYQGGMSKPERSRIAKLGAAASPVTKPKDGRMPATEAIKFLYDVKLSIREAIALINRDRRYRVKWNLSYAYQQNRQGKIKLPQRVAGPKLKRT